MTDAAAPVEDPRGARWRRAVLLVAFFASGAAGLVQEVAWARLLTPFLGNTAQAQAVVLGVFMGGLAAGSALFGRRADRAASPVRLYALLELAIGLYGFALPAIIRGCGAAFTALGSLAPEEAGTVRMLLRLGLAAGSVLVPSVLMGATLPVLARHAVRSVGETGARVAELYTANTFGAVAGAALGGFVLLERFGVDRTIFIASAAALAVGAFIWLALGRDAVLRTAGAMPAATPAAPAPAGGQAALFALVASGFAALLYEIVMVRVVGISLGSSTYAFTIMLVAFIVGVGVGSLAGSRLGRARPLLALGWCQLVAGATFLAITPVLRRLPYWASLIRCHCFPDDDRFACYQGLGTLAVLAVLILPTACLGAAFPLASQVTARTLGQVGSRVGWAYACNTVGNVAGAVVSGLVLMPLFGLGRTFEIGVLLNLAAAAIVLLPGATRRRLLALGVFAAVAAGAYLPTRDWPDGLNLTAMHFRLRQNPPASYATFLQIHSLAGKELFFEEDSHAAVLVAPVGQDISLFVNGKPDASATGDLTTQTLVAHVPLFLAQEPRTVLTIGYGSGITSGAVMYHPIERQDVVEISPAVLRADSVFRQFNGGVLSEPRVRVFLDDARSFVRLARRQYDVIISEPSNPWVAGVAGLFSREFFQDARARLAAGGVLCVWFHEYEQSSEAAAMVVRTLAAELPHVSVWREYRFTDMLLVASERPLAIDFAALERRFESVRDGLARVGIPSLAALLAHNAVTPEALRASLQPGPLHTDARPRLEFLAARAMLAGSASTFGWDIDQHYRALGGQETDLLLDRYLRWRRASGRALTRADIEDVRAYFGRVLAVDHPVMQRLAAIAARSPEPHGAAESPR
jgi:predicted membrane-bound spermidine synthase